MGLQQVQDVTLIRHAYVLTANQGQGIGARLLSHLCQLTNDPVLIGTWADAVWAIGFYEKHGFQIVLTVGKNRLLKSTGRSPNARSKHPSCWLIPSGICGVPSRDAVCLGWPRRRVTKRDDYFSLRSLD
jgi:N-acetylglutamate synthase-like GNAT family acetyltransferase